MHGNVQPDDSDSGVSNDDDNDLISRVREDATTIFVDGFDEPYRVGRWRRCGAPVPANQALAIAAKIEKERQRIAREAALKEGRAADFLWGSRAPVKKKGDSDEDSDESSAVLMPSPSSLSKYQSSDAPESPTFRRRMRVHELANNVAITVVATSPKAAFQSPVKANNPCKCGTLLAWKVPNLHPGSRWQFRVRCMNDIDWSDPSQSSDVLKLPCEFLD